MNRVLEEYKVLERVKNEMFEAKNRDTINKLYRQARQWNRFHHFYANACSYQKYSYINNKFKHFRWDALAALN